MRKYIFICTAALAVGYSAGALAASGNIGSGAFGTDNFVSAGASGIIPTGTSPGTQSGGFGPSLLNAFSSGSETGGSQKGGGGSKNDESDDNRKNRR